MLETVPRSIRQRMKTSAIAASALSLLTFACVAPEPEPDLAGERIATTDLATATTSAEGVSVLRGSFGASGARLTVEVELVSKQHAKQMKYCTPYVDEGEHAYAGASASPSYRERGGTITTRVRAEDGSVLGETTRDVAAFSAYALLDPARSCTDAGDIADTRPLTTFEADPLLWVPGVIATTPAGEVWINPSYGGVADAPVSLAGTAEFRLLSPATEATLHPRPFGGRGQELHFDRGELTFQPGPTLVLEVGTDVAGGALGFARHVESVTLTRR